MNIAISDGQEIEAMIDSRDWWIFVGTDPVFTEIEERFYPQKDWVTVFGPPPRQFAACFPGQRFMVLHFGRKNWVSPEQLDEFFTVHPRAANLPLMDFKHRDIVFLVEGEPSSPHRWRFLCNRKGVPRYPQKKKGDSRQKGDSAGGPLSNQRWTGEPYGSPFNPRQCVPGEA